MRVSVSDASGVTFLSAEVNVTSVARKGGHFNITSSGLTIGKQVMIFQATGAYTGKGTLADECEMDGLTVQAVVTSATNIKCFWTCGTFIKGKFKFNYLINQ